MTLAQRMSRLGTETAFEVLAKAKALEAQGRDIIHLHIGAPDFATPDNIVEAGRRALADGWHKYTPARGLPQLHEAVAADIARHRGVTIDPAHVLIVPGGKPTMFFAIMMLGEPGTEILYPNPGFPIYESVIRYSGAEAVPIRLSEAAGYSFSADEVLAQVNERTRLVIVNTPANPTGGVVPRSELQRLADGLEAFPNVYVLADEIYSRLLYDGEEHVSLLEFENIRERVILLDGWSKTWAMTGWRLGYGVWPAELIEHAERLQINSTSCTNAAGQIAAIEAMQGPQDAVDEMRAAFDERRAIIVEELNAIPGFTCQMPKGAFYAFPNTSGTGISSKELEERFLQEAGVACLSGASFGALGEGYMRFSYANSAENIREGLRRVRECLQPV
ncbi:MAG: pyridoxal phosphate-dependent aminotransferase [Planctomycetota bacterium]|nr:pyridoxal phosphate-dependent aminotransferase [Planctomycetota bacterium]MDP6955610.1 pyridoxal phosphate-dependent aminotransferase [Planctomycetota bacterium]